MFNSFFDGNSPRKIERGARWVVILAVVGSTVQGVLSSRLLFADGSFALWKLITDHGFFFTQDRIVAQFVTQLPPVVALNLGVTDVHALAILYGIGIVGVPWLAWAATFAVLRNDSFFWPMVAIFSATFLTTAFMSMGEYNFASGLVALSMALLLRGSFSTGRVILLVISAACLTVSYQSLLFLGPLLALTAGWRLFDVLRVKSRKISVVVGLSAAVVLYLVGAGFSAYWLINPRDPGNFSQASRVLHSIRQDPSFLIATLLCAVILLIFFLFPRKQTSISPVVKLLVTLVPLVLFFPVFSATPVMHYEARTASALVLFLALALMAWFRFRERPGQTTRGPKTKELAYTWLWVPAFILFTSQLAAMTSLTAGFSQWLDEFSQLTETSSSNITYEESASNLPGSPQYMWFWTNPYLSRIVSKECDGGVIQPPVGVSLQQMGMPDPSPLPAAFCSH